MKDCFGHGMQWWVPVKPGVSDPEKQRECFSCEDFDACAKAHTVHSNRHLAEIILHHVTKTGGAAAAKPKPRR